MNNRLLFLLCIILVPGYLFGADNPDAIRPLNLEGSMYTPGGEPAPLMIWVSAEKIKNIGISEYIKDALVCYPKRLKSIQHAAKRCNHYTECTYYPEDRVKVAIGRDDMQKMVDEFK